MRLRILAMATATMFLLVGLLTSARAQQSHWAAADDQTAKYIIDMERKWAEGVCVDNGVVARLLADDFQGTSTAGARFTKADELRDEKSERTAHDCGLDEAKVHYFGDSLALVYGREHAVGKDKSRPNAKICQVWTDTWLKRGDKWQIIASQDNRVECQ
ncbi:MAG: nuclear transport factor 2 family protein [Candidatus Sulfotelmatobacter sp.]